MKQCRERDLAFWKAEAVSWRNVVDRANNKTTKSYAEYFLRMSRRICEQIESKILAVLLLGCLFVGGCAKMLEGSGRIIEGLGDGVVAGGIHLQESSSSKD